MKVLEGFLTVFVLGLFVFNQLGSLDQRYPHWIRGDIRVGEEFVNTNDLNNPFLPNDTVVVLSIKNKYCLFGHKESAQDCNANCRVYNSKCRAYISSF